MAAYFLLTAAVLSIDTLTVGIAYGVNKIGFSAGGMLAFLGTGLAAALFSSLIGRVFAFVSAGKMIGGGLLIAAGLTMVLKQLGVCEDIPFFGFVSPEKTDIDHDKIIEFKEAVLLALALSGDGCAACVGAVAGGGGFLLPLLLFVFQPVFLGAGCCIGKKMSFEGCEYICGIIAGILLIMLGIGDFL